MSCTVQPGRSVGAFHCSSVSEWPTSLIDAHVSSSMAMMSVGITVPAVSMVCHSRAPRYGAKAVAMVRMSSVVFGFFSSNRPGTFE